MDFRLLGPVAVRRDDETVQLGGPKVRALLAMLLLEANRPVSRDRLIDGLWGEQVPASAEHSLDDYVSRLRKALGADRIERRAPGYVLHVDPDELDLECFERLAEEGRNSLSSHPNGAAERAFRDALALWQGAALADLVNEPFAAEAARRLEEERHAVVEDLIDVELRAGAGAELVPELQALVRAHPFSERLTGQLMRALYRAGRQGEALAAFQRLRRRLAEELGLEPGPQVRALEQEILTHAPGLERQPAQRASRPWTTRGRPPAAAIAGLAALALSVAIGVALGIGGSSGSPGRAAARGDRLVGLDAAGTPVASGSALAGAPAALAVGAGGLWIAAPDQVAVLHADEMSGAVIDRVPLPDAPAKIAVGGGAAWVATGIGRTVSRIDPRTGRIAQTIRLGVEPAALAFGAGQLWVADPGDSALLRIDPASGIVRATVALPSRPSAVAVGRTAVWVASHDDGNVMQVDPRTNSVVQTTAVGEGPAALALGADAVWVANSLDGTVSRIDPQGGRVVATVSTGSGPSDIAITGKRVWVANTYSRSVSLLDPARDSVVRTTHLDGQPTALAAAHGKVWVGVRSPFSHRGGTMVLLYSRRYLSIDPQVDYERTPALYLGLAYDGLVAWDHTDGPDGLQMVPDLALKLPAPSDGARTYRFQLRPGLRYSDGRRVLASDFARSIRRLRAVDSPGLDQMSVLRHRNAVVADDRARTITFHLAVPDPDFLLKLASGVFVPIPPGTPMHDVGKHPLAGTGPYEIAGVDAHRIRFVRNPRFREWSRPAQPDGNADVIEWRFGLTPAQEIRAIATGRADWSDEPPADLVRVARMRSLTVHSRAFPITGFIQLNTRRAPFDNLLARRALNYAVDRARVAREFGGPLAATPTCQILPPGVLGCRRYCPYTSGARANARWTGTDMRRARALVAESGTRGAPVTMWTISNTRAAEPGTRYMVDRLRRLGYRAQLRFMTTDAIAHASRAQRARMQLLEVVFGPAYPSPFDFFATFITCRGVFSWDQFCDPAIDRAVGLAQRLRLTSPAAAARRWAALDHGLVDRAIWVPLVNIRIVDFISKRIRGYQNSPIYQFMPAQAWLKR